MIVSIVPKSIKPSKISAKNQILAQQSTQNYVFISKKIPTIQQCPKNLVVQYLRNIFRTGIVVRYHCLIRREMANWQKIFYVCTLKSARTLEMLYIPKNYKCYLLYFENCQGCLNTCQIKHIVQDTFPLAHRYSQPNVLTPIPAHRIRVQGRLVWTVD